MGNAQASLVLASFLGGLLVIYIALASPLDAFASWLLSVHMVQHLLLTMVAPPLILQGAPFLPMLSELPRGFVRSGLGHFSTNPGSKKSGVLDFRTEEGSGLGGTRTLNQRLKRASIM